MRSMKGQGALEYLLLIGGAVLVAAIVIVLLLGINQQSSSQTGLTTASALCNTSVASDFPSNPSAVCSLDGTATKTTQPKYDKDTGAALADGTNIRTITVNGKLYDCAGRLPNCSSLCDPNYKPGISPAANIDKPKQQC